MTPGSTLQFRLRGLPLLWGGLWIVCFLPGMGVSGWAQDAAPVDAGREALEHGNFPWYDQSADRLRPVTGSKPAPTPPPRGPNISPPAIAAGAGIGLVVVWILIGVLIAAFIVAVVMMILNYRKVPQIAVPIAQVQPLAAEAVDALPEPARKHVGNLLSAAKAAYDAGKYNEAIVYLFSHQLLELDRADLIRLTKGKTNRQYLMELSLQPLKSLLGNTIAVFEDAFFGQYAIERTRFEACWTQMTAFERLVQGQGAV